MGQRETASRATGRARGRLAASVLAALAVMMTGAGVLTAGPGLGVALPVANAALSVTFHDDARLFTAEGRARIERAAEQNNQQVMVVTTRRPFATRADWQSWLNTQSQATGNRQLITIGLHAVKRAGWINASVGPQAGVTVAQAGQGVRDTLPTFRSSGTTEGVLTLLASYQAYAGGGTSATGPGSGNSVPAPAPAPAPPTETRGSGFGLLIPLVVIAAIAFAALRLLRRRGPTNLGQGPGMGNGPSNQGGPFNQGGYNQGPYNQGGYNQGGNSGNSGRGGGFMSGLAGGAVGGVAGALIGNELLNHNRDGGDNSGNANASSPSDTQSGQDMQGSWGGGDSSGADAGGWGGGGSSGGDSGGWGGADSGGGGGDFGGGGGGDSGGWS